MDMTKLRKMAMKARYEATMACNDDDTLDYQIIFENRFTGIILEQILDVLQENDSIEKEKIKELCDKIVAKFQ